MILVPRDTRRMSGLVKPGRSPWGSASAIAA